MTVDEIFDFVREGQKVTQVDVGWNGRPDYPVVVVTIEMKDRSVSFAVPLESIELRR